MKTFVLLSFLSFILLSCDSLENTVEITKKTMDTEPSLEKASAECLSTQVGETFQSGAGTVADPYFICNANQLQAVKDSPSDVFIVGDDIDLSSIVNFIPIGGCDGDYTCVNINNSPFTGSFDGNGYQISNLKISRTDNPGNVGLFGLVDGAVITDVNLVNADVGVTSTSAQIKGIGGIIGKSSGASSISNVAFSGDVSADSSSGSRSIYNVGGIIGFMGNSSTASDVHTLAGSNVNVSHSASNHYIRYVGGAVGFGYGNISKSSSKADINIDTLGGVAYVGGIGGQLTSLVDSYVSDSTISILNNPNIYGAGGLIGGTFSPTTATISNSFANNIDMSFNGGNMGSFIGYSYGGVDISNSFVIDSALNSYAGVNTSSFLGGFYTSYYNGTLTVDDVFTDGDINETNDAAAITKAEIEGKRDGDHDVFSTWDFDTVWEAIPGSLPKLRNRK
jgi:hypothetical protein